MKFQHILSIFLPFFFIIILAGCESMESRWQDAQSKNTVEAYENFIKDYPESPFDEEAKGKIIELQFESAKEKNTILAYEEFIEKYPESSFIEEAQSKITELQYEIVRQKNTTEDYKKFIEQYPLSSYAKDAQNEILNIFANEIRTSKSLKDKEAIENNMVKNILENGVGTRFVLKDILPRGNISVQEIVTLAELAGSHDQEAQHNYARIGGTQYNFTKIVSYKATGQSILAHQDADTDHFTFKTLYPKDKLYFKLSFAGASLLEPLGNQCIWRFIGKIDFKDYIFYGDSKEPLTFMLLKNVGFVYLHGKGTVKQKNQIIKALP